jgi:glycogen debranching enzyme
MKIVPLIALLAGTAIAADLAPIRNFAQDSGSLQIVSRCEPRLPWTVAGEHGTLLGRQDGTFEAWLWPVKIISHFRISADLDNYAVPIDVNALGAEIKVTPAETVITYSHAAFTIRQHMFAARGNENPATGVAAFFEIESARPLTLTFSFTADMLRMWPAPNSGRPDAEWVGTEKNGVYVLHTDDPRFSGIVAMPHTSAGIMVPYQEHPQTYPVQLLLRFDPARDNGSVFPLILGLLNGRDAARQAESVSAAIPQLYRETQSYYSHFFDNRVTVDTPNKAVNEAAQWAEVAIDQAQVIYRNGEIGLIAGYYESADSARPGYAWFFGRDTIWTTYAINSYGDFNLTKRALDFLIHRQRADGKMMHEFSQSADALDWKATPYFYASADAAPLFVMAIWDYVKASGDLPYLTQNWDAVQRAYTFTRAHDSDGDGIFENTEGTGWVESWPPGMPHQEIYLAALDQQSAEAISRLALLMKDENLAAAAQKKALAIRTAIESEYFEGSNQFYAFSRNPDGSLDHTASIYPSVAWWSGELALERAGPMLSRWASPEFSTDWGTRDISEKTSFYDPISYHQGTVWPLFTGWVSLAEYRAGRPLSGFAHLMQNVNLTWDQDLGSVTELLSGEFYQPLGRSSSHQLWSSAMVLAPMLRGLFGIECNVLEKTIRVAPHLPADWDGAALRNVPFGQSSVRLEFKRESGNLTVRAVSQTPQVLCLVPGDKLAQACQQPAATEHKLSLPLPAVEVAIPVNAPSQGARTQQLKVLNEEFSDRQATISFAAPGGSSDRLFVRFNRPKVTVSGAAYRDGHIQIQFPEGAGYQTQQVVFRWQ